MKLQKKVETVVKIRAEFIDSTLHPDTGRISSQWMIDCNSWTVGEIWCDADVIFGGEMVAWKMSFEQAGCKLSEYGIGEEPSDSEFEDFLAQIGNELVHIVERQGLDKLEVLEEEFLAFCQKV